MPRTIKEIEENIKNSKARIDQIEAQVKAVIANLRDILEGG